MPYSSGLALIALCLIVVFATFFYIAVNARTVARIFRGGDSDVVVGPGSDRKTAGKGAIIAAILVHFLAWAVAGFVFLSLQAETRATAPDETPLEDKGLVTGNGSSPR